MTHIYQKQKNFINCTFVYIICCLLFEHSSVGLGLLNNIAFFIQFSLSPIVFWTNK